jgi:hypothetical protein
METANIIWVFVFSILFVSINVLYNLIAGYIDSKPLGLQSLFDAVIKQHFR